MFIITPPCTLQEQPINVAPRLWLFLDFLCNWDHSEVETDGINGDAGLTSIILQCTRNECLGEEETGNPEYVGDPIHIPVVHKLETLKMVELIG